MPLEGADGGFNRNILKKLFTFYFAFHCRLFVDPQLSTVLLSQLISQILVRQMPFLANLEVGNLKKCPSRRPNHAGSSYVTRQSIGGSHNFPQKPLSRLEIGANEVTLSSLP